MKFKALSLLIICILAIGCKRNEGSTKTIRKVKCESATLSNSPTVTSTFSGKVSAARDVNIGFRVGGVIQDIFVHEGEFVHKGQIIAQMDNRDYTLQLEATEAEWAAVKGEVERIKAMYRENGVTQNDYEKAINGLRGIEAKLASHRNALSDTELKAPFDCYIQKIIFDESEAVAAGMAVISLISASMPELIVNIPAIDYINIGKLESASATINIYDSAEFPLRLIGVTRKSNLNQLYSARFSIEPYKGVNPEIGLTAIATFNYNNDANESISFPLKAVVEDNGLTYVWIINNGVATRREVSITKVQADGYVLSNSGLKGGELIITAGTNSLKEGQEVEALPQPSPTNFGNIL